LLGIAPTGRAVTVAAMELFRLADGKIAEQWVIVDALGMSQQLGAVPGPGPGEQ
jgi:predicted ester cyclase